MAKGVGKKEEQIKESVCKFYLDKKDSCDFYYSNAESINIGNIYEDIVNINDIYSLFIQTSFVVITANKYEKNILHDSIFRLQKRKIKKFAINLFPKRESKQETYAYCFMWQEYMVLHIEAQSTGSYTIGGSADIVRYVLDNEYIVPKGIISLGICFGVDENNYQLGDVIISRKVYPYFIGSKIQEKGYFVTDDNAFVVDSDLKAKIRFIIDKNAFSELENKVYFDNYITGEAVVSRRKARDEFAHQTKQKIIAGEMEGYGLFKECRGTYYSIPCLIIKSICDWAVMKNFDSEDIFRRLCSDKDIISEKEQMTLKDRIQAYSAFQAFQTLDILIKDKIFGESIFTDIITYVKQFQGHAIYASKIKNEIEQISKKSIGNVHIADKFVIMVIKELLNLELIGYDDIAEIKNTVDNNKSEIGEWLFTIRGRDKNVKK